MGSRCLKGGPVPSPSTSHPYALRRERLDPGSSLRSYYEVDILPSGCFESEYRGSRRKTQRFVRG
jgi:hypothetical protein